MVVVIYCLWKLCELVHKECVKTQMYLVVVVLGHPTVAGRNYLALGVQMQATTAVGEDGVTLRVGPVSGQSRN